MDPGAGKLLSKMSNLRPLHANLHKYICEEEEMIVRRFGGRKCRDHKNSQRHIQNHFRYLRWNLRCSTGF